MRAPSLRTLLLPLFGVLGAPLAPLAAGQPELFRRLDTSCDGVFDVTDAVLSLEWLFARGAVPCCLDAADADDTGDIDIGDPLLALGVLFQSGAKPPAPFPDCGPDPTDDPLGCAGDSRCEPVDAPPEIREWTVPWPSSRPRDPYVDDAGRVWFVGQVGNYAAYLVVESGEFRRFALPAGTGPHNLIVGDHVWYAGNLNAVIGRLDKESGEILEIDMPDPDAEDPHTLIFDASGDLWFTVQNGNFVGRLETLTREVRLVPVPTSGARPYGIVLDSGGRPWVALFGTNKLATLDPVTLAIEEITLPRSGARPRRLQATSNGDVWYVDYSGGYLGRYRPSMSDPATGEVVEWPAPGGGTARPYGMAVDHRDRLWFVETRNPNRLVGFNPATEEFFGITEIPSGGGTVRHMFFHEPLREIWFGTDANTIGRARLE
jgi:virginiamycin B lyase